MIEQGIYFALGCIVTALLALGFAPIFWARALRLTRSRLQLQVPLSFQEILAERDGLRAEFAVEQLRIEQAMERVQATKAADMAEIGRRDVAASGLIDQIDALKLVQQTKEAEIGRLEGALADSRADTSAVKQTLQDTIGDRDERVRENVRLDQDIARREIEQSRLEEVSGSRRTMIVSLETRIMGLEMQLIDSVRSVAREEGVSSTLRGRLETAMAEASRHETSGLSLRRELDEARAHIDERAREIVRLERDIAQRETERSRLEDEGESHRTMIASLEARTTSLEMQLTDSVRSVAREEGASSTLRGRLETAMAQAARHETSGLSLRRELDEARTRIRTLEAEGEERDAMRETKLADSEPSNKSREESLAASMRARSETSVAPAAVQDAPVLSLRRELEEARVRIGALEAEVLELGEKPRAVPVLAMPAKTSHDDAADGGLRDSIHALGLAVATMTRNARPAAFAKPLARRKRDKAPSPIDAA